MVPPPSTLVDDSLHRLCERLVALHFSVDITVEMLCGEPDVRLRVCRHEDPDVTVELLGPDATTWSSQSWDAVRVQYGYRRVWRGPDQECSLDEVATFVSALLRLGAGQLAHRYVDLG